MAAAWRKAKLALGMRLCVYAPTTNDDGDAPPSSRPSDAAAAPDSPSSGSYYHALMPTTPTPTSSGLRLSKSGSRASKKMCAICLGSMKPGHGHALFTAECSHTFHFHCIASNVKHGNQVCPVCRAKWKDIPFQGPLASELPHGRARVNPVIYPQEDGYMTILRRPHRSDSSNHPHHITPLFHNSEPIVFNDDEPLDLQAETPKDSQQGCTRTVDIKTYSEFSAVPQSECRENFGILIHLKAPRASTDEPVPGRSLQAMVSQTSRAPVDLVTVLDVSGSMAGTKLALLKRAMGFVIQSLGPSDRLSVIAFSSTARRLFPLRRMSDTGRQQALQAVNSLFSSGGTNIAEGLRKGAQVIEERKEKNPVCSIILLSDGQDTYTVSSIAAGVAHREQPDYRSLVPSSIRCGASHQIPVHVFGFGADHDSASMHSISEISGGTFSFIETEGVIQDAFAQCIGGLLSVVAQEMRVWVECLHPGSFLAAIKSGSYASRVVDDGQMGSIDVGDLYADEERDFLVSVHLPAAGQEVPLLRVDCVYRDPVSKEMVSLEGKEVRIQRPLFLAAPAVSIEVDRERNRIQAAEAMEEARASAELGFFSQAVSILEERRKIISESLAGRSGDRLCMALDAELKEMQERMAGRQRYEASGRAYVLSGLSSHSWQRATARGDSTDSASLVHAYQTPSMVDMLQRSQTMNFSPRRPIPPIRPARSFPVQAQPR